MLPIFENLDISNNRNQAIRIAREIDIPYSKLPCMVFFTRLENKDVAVYSLDNSWDHAHMAEHMKSVFDAIRKTLDKTEIDDETPLLDELNSKFKKIERKKWIKRITTRQSLETLLKAVATGATVA